MGITIETIVSLFSEDFQSVEVFNLEKEKTVFKGTVRELLDDTELGDEEVQSIDALSSPTTTITINI